jgi:hypothetical protein
VIEVHVFFFFHPHLGDRGRAPPVLRAEPFAVDRASTMSRFQKIFFSFVRELGNGAANDNDAVDRGRSSRSSRSAIARLVGAKKKKCQMPWHAVFARAPQDARATTTTEAVRKFFFSARG